MDNLELIDKYLNGEMSGSELTLFEQSLDVDPLLKKEFKMQQDIVNGIKSVRANELKTRLDAIDVSGTINPSNILNLKTIGIAAAIIGGIIIYASVENEIPESSSTNPVVENIVIEKAVEIDSDEGVDNKTITDPTDNKTDKIATNRSVSKEEDIIAENSDVSDDFGDFEDEEENYSLAPDNFMLDKGMFDQSSIEVEINDGKKKYSFHYQLREGKLLLFGEFNEIYEVLEFKNNIENDLIFYYNNKYYDIDENQPVITPLVEMTVEETTELKIKINGNNDAKSQ